MRQNDLVSSSETRNVTPERTTLKVKPTQIELERRTQYRLAHVGYNHFASQVYSSYSNLCAGTYTRWTRRGYMLESEDLAEHIREDYLESCKMNA